MLQAPAADPRIAGRQRARAPRAAAAAGHTCGCCVRGLLMVLVFVMFMWLLELLVSQLLKKTGIRFEFVPVV